MAPCSAATFGLMPRQECAVARDDDGALHRDAEPLELLVVLGQAVVDVDERPGHVAVDRVGVVGRQLLGLLAGRRVDGDDRLVERQRGTASARSSRRAAPSASGRARRRSRSARPSPTRGSAPGSTRRSRGRRPSRRGAAARSAAASPRACSRGSASRGTSPPTRDRGSRRGRLGRCRSGGGVWADAGTPAATSGRARTAAGSLRMRVGSSRCGERPCIRFAAGLYVTAALRAESTLLSPRPRCRFARFTHVELRRTCASRRRNLTCG